MNGVGTTDKNKTQQNKIQHNSHKNNKKNKLKQTNQKIFFNHNKQACYPFLSSWKTTKAIT